MATKSAFSGGGGASLARRQRGGGGDKVVRAGVVGRHCLLIIDINKDAYNSSDVGSVQKVRDEDAVTCRRAKTDTGDRRTRQDDAGVPWVGTRTFRNSRKKFSSHLTCLAWRRHVLCYFLR